MAFQLVVVVDNSAVNLKILARLALSLDEDTVAKEFADPDAALSFCTQRRPDLVVAAAEMAQGEAAGFIERLHEAPGCAEIPIIVVGAYEDRECIDRALAAGAADHLLSPVNHHEFQVRARNLLHLRRYRLREADQGVTADDSAAAPEVQDQAALRRAHERLLRVIDAVPAMICATDREGRYIFGNQRFAAFIGVRPARLIGRRPIEAHDGPLARRLMDLDAQLLAGETLPAAFEEESLDHEGNPHDLLTTKAVFRGGEGEDAIVVTVALDITARKRAELDLIAVKDQAEIANRSKTEFLANMSHELRTPLNAIIGFSQVMAGEMLGPITTQRYVGYARDILASAEHLLGIINDILDVSKLETGTIELSEEVIDVAKAVADLIRLVEPKARAGEITIALRREGEVPPLRADLRKLKQIVLNLVTNAIKFSRPGSEVEIVLRNEAGAVSIAISDRGIGMDGREIELAMARFGQVTSPWARRHAGTGLGLPLANGLADLHGAALTIQSIKGVGTTVTVAFPPERSQAPLEMVPADARSAG